MSQEDSPPGRFPPPARILVIDDDEVICELCAEVLKHAGYRVDTAGDGETGWAMLHPGRYEPDGYDLLITDNNMPKLSGVGLIKMLRSVRMTLPVILISGVEPLHAEWLHLEAILLKPFSPDQLVQAVKKALPAAGRGRQ